MLPSNAAIRAGASGMPPLELTDYGGLFSGAGSGYRVILYTPHSWIAHLAETAAAEGEELSAAEIGNQGPRAAAPCVRVTKCADRRLVEGPILIRAAGGAARRTTAQ